MSDDNKKDPNWMQNLWRPMMGWMYMLICLLDMAVFPVLWSLLQAMQHQPITQWNPLTLQGAGLFHIAMGAVLGIAAFGRTQEKLAGSAVNPAAPAPAAPAPAAPAPVGFNPAPVGFNPTPAPAFGPSSFGSAPVASPAPSFGASFPSTPMATTSSGKKIVPDEPQPEI